MGESQGNVDIWGWSRIWDAPVLQSQLSPLQRGTLIRPKKLNPMGPTRPITGVFRFSIPYISPINSNITFNPKKHTWNEENILMSGSSMENMI